MPSSLPQLLSSNLHTQLQWITEAAKMMTSTSLKGWSCLSGYFWHDFPFKSLIMPLKTKLRNLTEKYSKLLFLFEPVQKPTTRHSSHFDWWCNGRTRSWPRIGKWKVSSSKASPYLFEPKHSNRKDAGIVTPTAHRFPVVCVFWSLTFMAFHFFELRNAQISHALCAQKRFVQFENKMDKIWHPIVK